MKATNRLAILAVITGLGVGSVTASRADDLPERTKAGTAEGQATRELNKDINRNAPTDRYTASDTRSERRTGVSDVHKASSVMGMKVKNQSDETLGTIEDLVVDLQSGKISYAVLGVGGFLGVGEKYIAVPPSAFSAGLDDKTLVLNADKAKLQAAAGFVKTNWPDYRHPDFGAEGFWDNASVGGSTGVTSGTDRSSSLRDLNREKKNDDKTDRELNKRSAERPNP